MQPSIWSSPQVGGSGGALKALARNVANHLKLSRPTLKRVVAQVVAQHHSLGEVADYKGHMYFAKPDRLNFPELIAQSKEAFDDLRIHEPRLVKGSGDPSVHTARLRPRTKVQDKKDSRIRSMIPSKVPLPPRKGIPVAPRKSNVSPPPPPHLPAVNPGKHRNRRRSSTTIFQLTDAGRGSLNGVIVDDTHLPQDGEQREILLHVPPSRKRRRSIKTRNSSQLRVQEKLEKWVKRENREKWEKLEKRENREKQEKREKRENRVKLERHKLLLKPKCKPSQEQQQVPPPVQHHIPAISSSKKLLSRRSQRQLNARGHQLRGIASGRVRRLPAGATHHPAPRVPFHTVVMKPPTKIRSKLRPRKKRIPLLQRTYDKPWLIRRIKKKRMSGGRSNKEKETQAQKERLDKINVEWVPKSEKSEKSLKSEISEKSYKSARVKKSKPVSRKHPTHVGRQMRNVTFPWYTPFQFQGAAGATQMPSVPRSRRNGAPYSLPRTQNFTNRQKHKHRLQERLLRDLRREEAIDEAPSNNSGLIFRRRSPKVQRSVERVSSRSKRSPGSPIPAAGSSPPRNRRRHRPVPVDSSLGSLAGLGAGQDRDSRHSLTPAKRHLTIAFSNKRLERDERHRQLPQQWK
ncbi:hypothetical protein KR009_002256 [Drosophila setifemur]|nr:hypothetical protein KR009_002256 [Drosophila setifemur]